MDYKNGYAINSNILPAIVSVVGPLQGFNDFLVYVRPRLGSSFQHYDGTLLGSQLSQIYQSTLSNTLASSELTSPTIDDHGDPSAAIAARPLVNDEVQASARNLAVVDPSAMIASHVHRLPMESSE